MTQWWVPWAFPFPSYCPDLELNKLAAWKCQWRQILRSPNKSLLSQVIEPGKGNPAREKPFTQSCSTPDKHYRKNCGLTPPMPAKAEWGARTTTLPRLQWGSLTPPAGWCPKARYGATVPVGTCGPGVWEAGHRGSHPGPAVQGTALALGVHGSSAGSLGFHLTRQSQSSTQEQRRVKQEI